MSPLPNGPNTIAEAFERLIFQVTTIINSSNNHKNSNNHGSYRNNSNEQQQQQQQQEGVNHRLIMYLFVPGSGAFCCTDPDGTQRSGVSWSTRWHRYQKVG